LPTIGEHPAETAQGSGKVELAVNALIKIEDRVGIPTGCNGRSRACNGRYDVGGFRFKGRLSDGKI